MGQIGRYCKAYYLKEFRQFGGWTEKAQDLEQASADESAGTNTAAPRLETEDFLYLQEDFTVTRGIFTDENIVFDNITKEWIEFCRDTLRFEPPAREPLMAAVVSQDAR